MAQVRCRLTLALAALGRPTPDMMADAAAGTGSECSWRDSTRPFPSPPSSSSPPSFTTRTFRNLCHFGVIVDHVRVGGIAGLCGPGPSIRDTCGTLASYSAVTSTSEVTSERNLLLDTMPERGGGALGGAAATWSGWSRWPCSTASVWCAPALFVVRLPIFVSDLRVAQPHLYLALLVSCRRRRWSLGDEVGVVQAMYALDCYREMMRISKYGFNHFTSTK